MNKFEKLKQHIECQAKYYTDLADEARSAMDTEGSGLKKEMLFQTWKNHNQKARAIFEIINFINNMEN